MEHIDENNGTYGYAQDFEKPKQFVHFDPYFDTVGGLGGQSTIDSQYAALRYDDQNKIRASIIIDVYKRELKELEETVKSEHIKLQD